MPASSKPLKWLWEVDKATPEHSAAAVMRRSFENHSSHSLPCLSFTPGNALLVHPVTDKEAKAVSVLLPGSEEVRIIQSCSAHTSVLYGNLPAPHLIIAARCHCAEC